MLSIFGPRVKTLRLLAWLNIKFIPPCITLRVSKLERSKRSNINRPENICCISVTFGVSKELRSNSVKSHTSWNMFLIVITLRVSKEVKFRVRTFESSNILCMVMTWLVLNIDKSRSIHALLSLSIRLNILLISVTWLVLKEAGKTNSFKSSTFENIFLIVVTLCVLKEARFKVRNSDCSNIPSIVVTFLVSNTDKSKLSILPCVALNI